MIKKAIKFIRAIPEMVYNRMVFALRKPVYEQWPSIRGRIYMVSRRGAISFGKGVKINSSIRANPIGGSCRTILFAEPGAKIIIGDHVGISNAAIHAARSVTIEDDVMIGGDCRIYDTDFHWVDADRRKNEFGGACAPVVIKKGAFLGANCTVLKGVTIGENAVIGACSVVTKNIPDNEIWAGNPARFIKKISEM